MNIAIVVESTTANDVSGVSGSERVCALGEGAVVSFMDRATVYDKRLYDSAMQTAKENGIKAQTKSKIAGGNDAGAIQSAADGVRVLALSVPTRNIHSASCVANINDMQAVADLLECLLARFGEKE